MLTIWDVDRFWLTIIPDHVRNMSIISEHFRAFQSSHSHIRNLEQSFHEKQLLNSKNLELGAIILWKKTIEQKQLEELLVVFAASASATSTSSSGTSTSSTTMTTTSSTFGKHTLEGLHFGTLRYFQPIFSPVNDGENHQMDRVISGLLIFVGNRQKKKV